MVRELRLDVPVVDAEAAADRLWGAGAQAIEERPEHNGRIELRTVLAASDTDSERRVGELPAGWTLEFADVDATPADLWRDRVEAVAVSDRLVIAPAWKPLPEPRHDDDLVVAIDPGAAFGLGDHPTTRLTARLLDGLDLAGNSVLDVGCGTGVLSIIAAAFGAERVLAIDVSAAALEATAVNARRNRVAIEIDPGPLAVVHDTFDVVVANILAPTLIELADDLERVTRRELLISGILANAHDHVIEALAGFEVVATLQLDGWAAVRLRPCER